MINIATVAYGHLLMIARLALPIYNGNTRLPTFFYTWAHQTTVTAL